jgi:hypothetical protein
LTSKFIEDENVDPNNDTDTTSQHSDETGAFNTGLPDETIKFPGETMTEYHMKCDNLEFSCGPYTLLALCKDFCRNVAMHSKHEQKSSCILDQSVESAFSENLTTVDSNLLNNHLDSLCHAASMNYDLDWSLDVDCSITLPPKQLLLMAQSQFFQRVDYSTNVFVQSHFLNQVERVYTQPLTAKSETWAVCFNVIILLGIGCDSINDTVENLEGVHFVQPFLSAVRGGFNHPRILTIPRLINVQTVTLLVGKPTLLAPHTTDT